MAAVVQRPSLIVADRWKDYQLLETGAGMKQEKWGDYTLVRPDPQIIWPRAGGAKTWPTWDGLYHRSETGGGQWEFKRPLPEHWEIGYALQGAPGAGSTLRFKIRPTSFKHTGLFPEQAVNWEWCAAKIGGRINRRGGRAAAVAGSPEPKGARVPGAEGADAVQVLNLFGYTGAATCAAAAAGASVCHVDAAEGMVKWCRENAALSGLSSAPIRFIVDDCLKFVRREQKRGRKYDAIIMDPPTYGRGSTGEMWKLEDHLWELLTECKTLLSDRPLFFLINAYTARLSPTVVANLLSALMGSGNGSITAGEVGLPAARDGKILPCGIYGRWEAE